MIVPGGVVRDVTDVNDSVGGDCVSSYGVAVEGVVEKRQLTMLVISGIGRKLTLSIYLFVGRSISLLICLSVGLFFYLSIDLSICM